LVKQLRQMVQTCLLEKALLVRRQMQLEVEQLRKEMPFLVQLIRQEMPLLVQGQERPFQLKQLVFQQFKQFKQLQF